MTTLQRKVALMEKAVTVTVLARRMGVAPQHVSQVLYGKRRSPRVEQAIADAIGKPLHKVFPKATQGAA